MKKAIGRKALIFFLVFIWCIPIIGSPYGKAKAAAGNEREKITNLVNFLEGRANSVSKELDVNSDKKINAVDLTLLKRQVILNSKETVTKNRTTTTAVQLGTAVTTKSDTVYDYSIVDEAAKAITITDTRIPAYKGNLYENNQAVYLFKAGDKVYAYTILSLDNMAKTTGQLLTEAEVVGGMHIWLYKGEQSAYLSKDTPANSNLLSYAKISHSDVLALSRMILGLEEVTSTTISKYDYNQNKKLDKEDLQIMMKYKGANPKSMFRKINTDAWNIFFNELPKMTSLTNIVLVRSTQSTPVMYTYCIPTAGMNNPDYEGVFSDFPVQVLPTELQSTISAKYTEDPFASDTNHNFVVWEPLFKNWAYGSNTEPSNWEFKAGYYIYVLDSNGNMVKKWIE